MDKQLLIRFIEGSSSEAEQKQAMNWICESEDNERCYISLKNFMVARNMPQTRARESDFSAFCDRYSLGGRDKRLTGKSKLRIVGVTAVAAATVATLLTLTIACMVYHSGRRTMYAEFSTNTGVKGMIDLPDGSQVWLNSGSYIRFPERFDGAYRQVEFSGEAYFSVAKNPDCPMLVSVPGKVQIEVRGTKFNLSCYPNDNKIKATLYSGEIIVYSEDANTGARTATNLHPFETVCIANASAAEAEPDTNKLVIEPVRIEKDSDALKHTAWKRGELLFDACPLDDALRKLERWHGVEFVVTSENIYRHTLTARFKSESIQQIMEMLKICCPIEFEMDKNVVVIRER